MDIKRTIASLSILFFIVFTPLLMAQEEGFESEHTKAGSLSYDDFQKAKYCGSSCHTDFYREWQQTMMSKAYTHHWDEIEYFELAVPHGKKVKELEPIIADCNGCHTPFAFLSGHNPPARPDEGTMANESVSCDVCHTIKGVASDTAHNYNYIIAPGDTKYTTRKGKTTSPNHKIAVSEFHGTAKFCGICHNEKSPYGAWVKSTQLEWEDGPYSKEGVQCQDCHMPKAESKTASMGATYPDARHHLFHGAHVEGKVKGTIELKIHADITEAEPGLPVKFTTVLFNQKTGHKFPTGSVEDRIVWLHVEAEDAEGNKYHIPVDKKGFEGEEYTIAADVLAYSDMGVPLDKPDFEGVQRDGVPVGDRIFRMPYFTKDGVMTIQQWNTSKLGVDYRFPPRGGKTETHTFKIPYEAAPGKMKVTATLWYAKLVKPVADFLGVPEEESEPILVNEHTTEITIY